MTMKILSPTSKSLLFAGMVVVILLVGVFDYATGSEMAFSIFYLFPVGAAAWFIGWKSGAALSVLSALIWYSADLLARGEPYSNPYIPAWNAGVRLITLLIVTYLLIVLHETLQREAVNARIDSLTGSANSRAFYEAAEAQISLLKRYQRPFSIRYMDIDDFKALNDAQGHSAGDRVLQDLASTLKRNLRVGDTIARLGGDEFVVLLSDADARAAELVSTRIQSTIRQKLPITCSIGELSCSSPPASVDELIEKVDNLMYEAKRGGKDTKMSSTFTGN